MCCKRKARIGRRNRKLFVQGRKKGMKRRRVEVCEAKEKQRLERKRMEYVIIVKIKTSIKTPY